MRSSIVRAAALCLVIVSYASIADARNQTALMGVLYPNPSANETCMSTSGGGVENTCGSGSYVYNVPLIIDNSGAKTPIIYGTAVTAEGTLTCRGYEVGTDGTLGTSSSLLTWDGSNNGNQTLSSVTLAASETYIVGCTIGWGAALWSVRYSG